VKLDLPSPVREKHRPIVFEQNRQSGTKWKDTRKNCTMRDFMISTPKQIIFKLSMTYKILFKLSMTYTVCGTHGKEEKYIQGINRETKTENTWKTKE